MVERTSKDDCFSLFLMCAPRPQFLTQETIYDAKRNALVSMNVVFYVIQKIFRSGLKVDKNAEGCFDNVYKNSTNCREKVINSENFFMVIFVCTYNKSETPLYNLTY